MTGIIIGGVVLFIIILLVRQNSIDEKKKREEEQRKAEQKRLADIQAKKIADQKKAEVERLKKIEDEKYETVFVVSTSISADGKHQAYFKRNNNTFLSVTTTTALTANSNIKQLKENTAKWNWMSATDFEKIKEKAQKDKEKAEQQKLLLIKQIEEKKQLQYCEANTKYASTLNNIFQNNPANFNFASIRSICRHHDVWHELENGVAILTTYEQLSQYIFSYGNMHQAKLLQAFQASNLQLDGQKVEIIDYGCGQGIGTIVMLDYLKQNTAFNFTIDRVKLIEPSELALKRAALNVRLSLKSANQNQNVYAVPKEIDDITLADIETNSQTVKVHIFSNILDVEDFSIYTLFNKIQSSQKGLNYFICVSPNIMQSRNERLDEFQGYFSNASTISQRESDIPNRSNSEKPYRRYERIFKVQIGQNATSKSVTLPKIKTTTTNNYPLDDLPF